MPSDTLFFTGAPAASALNWDDNALLEGFSDSVARFIGILPSEVTADNNELQGATSRHAAWRTLDLDRKHLNTGHSQIHGFRNDYHGDTEFFTAADLSSLYDVYPEPTYEDEKSQALSSESREEVLSQFYEHSFAVHANIASSQINAHASSQGTSVPNSRVAITGSHDVLSTVSDLSGSLSESSLSSLPAATAPSGGYLSDLEDIPNASFLQKILPQTMTVNIIVGIISISEPRSILTRRGAKVELIELIVGDETKSGFGVNFWLNKNLRHDNASHSGQDLGLVLTSFRPRDIILVRNVALSTFRGKVYGQSLRKDMTKVHLLYRDRVDRLDVGGCYTLQALRGAERDQDQMHPQVKKTKRVREWVLRFVGTVPLRSDGEEKALTVGKEILPPDTQ